MRKEPTRIVLVLAGRLDKTAMSGFCVRVRALIEESAAGEVVCDVAGVHPDAVAVDLLGRLRLAVLRAGCGFRVEGLPDDLEDLLDLCGLSDLAVPD